MVLNEMAQEAYKIAQEHGWHDDNGATTFGDRIALMHSELSEALEEFRAGRGFSEIWYSYDIELHHEKIKGLTEDQVYTLTGSTPEELDIAGKPEGIPIELIDLFIRLLDASERYGVDLDRALAIKTDFNRTRPYKHGNKVI